ncbi:homeobox-leucine zipper protein HOX11-like [Vitis riparia]|uniref:homeobox-leucine zipper protein HOX11-like n=1 Tax=Vitis riparia TaxID=96939 RepID=UPI00155A8336|nr:homeobox-leucine zipper protein HOX11-like [Vitis riparia]
MELELSLGDASSKPFAFMEKAHRQVANKGLGFSMGLGLGSAGRDQEEQKIHEVADDDDDDDGEDDDDGRDQRASMGLPLQLDLLPLAPVPRNQASHQGLTWPSDNGSSEAGSSGNVGLPARGLDVNRLPSTAVTAAAGEEVEDGAAAEVESSPNSAASSFQMDFCIYRGGNGGTKRDFEGGEAERASSRASDEDDNGLTRKKLRLSKEQSAFLEESFKEHNTLNPKQKLALAKQLNLRPRQVEVWFQNRRARTKLKQTEVDCEYLKRCCETLTEENRRLHKELQELRALKTSNPFYMQLPATTLTMCPSCERVAATSTAPSAAASTATTATDPSTTTTANRPRFYPFSHQPPGAS